MRKRAELYGRGAQEVARHLYGHGGLDRSLGRAERDDADRQEPVVPHEQLDADEVAPARRHVLLWRV